MIDDKIREGFKAVPKRAWQDIRTVYILAWDLGLKPKNREYWVRNCPSVYSTNGITRPLVDHEIAAIWDYQLPDGDDMDSQLSEVFLEGFLSGPPGKMLRKITAFLWDQICQQVTPSNICTRDIDYSSAQVEVQAIKDSDLKAAHADNTPIDLEILKWPGETDSQTLSCDLLRSVGHSFWRLNLTREALDWLYHSPHSVPADFKVNCHAIRDCLRRAADSTYWD